MNASHTLSINLHAIDDSASVQRALSSVIKAVAAGTLDPARAKVLLYGLQIAGVNARRLASAQKAGTPVRAAVEVTEENTYPQIEAGNARVEAVDGGSQIEQAKTRHEASTEDVEAPNSEATLSSPNQLHAHPSPSPMGSSCAHRTYEMEARSRMTTLKRLRDERINSTFTQSKRISRPFGDE